MKISLFGCGYGAERLYYEILDKNLADVVYVFDNFADGRFHNIEIKKPELSALKKYPICVTVEDADVYEQIKIQLNKMGLEEFSDYYWRDALLKKIVVIHANCYGPIIRDVFRKSERFNANYMIYDIPEIYRNEKGFIDETLLRNCDIFIHQDIQAANSFGYKLSDEYCKTFLKKDCLDICIPNLVGMGKCLFCNCEADNKRNRRGIGAFEWGLFSFSDGNIDDLISENMDQEEIIRVLSGPERFHEDLIKINCKKIFDKYKERERNWDIRIIDYIEENFQKRKCFYDLYHPTEFVFEFILKHLFLLLGIENGGEEIHIPPMDVSEMPVYPAVGTALELEYFDSEIRKSQWAGKLRPHMSVEEYIKEYIFWCYGC